MEASSSSFSSDPNPTPRWCYHVFLSFRGKDTRYSFTDHLYSALWRKGIITFRDDEELERGEVINHELLQAIEESLCSVVILSQNYASSTWCLDELQKILECRKAFGRGVLPIFYGVDPSTVRHQTGSFADAFRKHEERFGEDKAKIQRWRDALSEVCSLSGYDSKNRLESKLIEEISTTLWTKLEPNLPKFLDHEFVGIDTKIKDMGQNLEIESPEVRFVGIWGMGGIGKTTLATMVFNQFRSHFDIGCYLQNIREKSSAVDGLLRLQIELLSKLKIGNLDIDNLNQGQAILRNLLPHRKVLLFLDDVHDIGQLKHLAGNLDWFGQGSRIIVTTRDLHLLESHDAPFRCYEIEVLNNDESFELFCQNAFKRNQPKEGYEELSQILVQYCRGLPLALRVLGSHFCVRDLSMWEDSLKKIRKDPPRDILDTLRISYEGLDDAEKTIFLDIACHFKGWSKKQVTKILEDCDFSHKIGIQILIERSLLTCHGNCFQMHDLLEEMGKKIVIEKSNNEIGKQSRLWSPEDIDEVLKKNRGTGFVQSVALKDHNYDGRWDPNAFSNMHNLRILIISHGLPLPFGLKCLPDSLKVIWWNGFPLKFLPICSELNTLVDLKMCHSKIKRLWIGIQNFGNLKFIDLSYSKDLIQTPNFVRVPNLESLILEGCSNLGKVHESVAQLKKIVILNLKDCINIKYLPKKLETKSLKDFILCGCSKLKKLPGFDEDMEGVSTLDLRGCKNLDCLPNSIWNSKHLKDLDISGCSKLIKLPEPKIMNANKSLERLDMSETAIQEVPSFVSCFQNLERLSVRGCRGPMSNPWWKLRGNSGLTELKLPPLSSFLMLREFDASYCNIKDGSILDDLSCLSSLKKLNLSGNNFVTLPPSCISNHHRLWELRLDDCPRLQTLPMLPPFLYKVSAANSGPMELIPDTEIWKLSLKMFDEVDPKKKSFSGYSGISLTMPGNEIPAWLDKQENVMPGNEIPAWSDKQENAPIIVEVPPRCCVDLALPLPGNEIPARLDEEEEGSYIKIKIDVPHCCRSSHRWGIVLCLLVEPTTLGHPKGKRPVGDWDFLFRFKALEDGPSAPEDNGRYFLHLLQQDYCGLNQPHLVIISLSPSSVETIRKAIGDGHDKVGMEFWCEKFLLADCVCDDDKHVHCRWKFEPLKISRCSWRVICDHEV